MYEYFRIKLEMATTSLSTEEADLVLKVFTQECWGRKLGIPWVFFFCFFLLVRRITDHFIGKSVRNIVSNSSVG